MEMPLKITKNIKSENEYDTCIKSQVTCPACFMNRLYLSLYENHYIFDNSFMNTSWRSTTGIQVPCHIDGEWKQAISTTKKIGYTVTKLHFELFKLCEQENLKTLIRYWTTTQENTNKYTTYMHAQPSISNCVHSKAGSHYCSLIIYTTRGL